MTSVNESVALYHESEGIRIYHGDIRGLSGLRVSSVVTDPPYGLRFMSKKWDYSVPGVEQWEAVMEAMIPGANLLSFAGTRTQHRMCVNIEDAGFEIRDMIAWVYGSGFPKSLNLGKATGDEQWDGWGTALKPALEPITFARKPFKGSATANVIENGVGGINVDGCRVETSGESRSRDGEESGKRRYQDIGATNFAATPGVRGGSPLGRFPANLIHDGSDEVTGLFPESKGQQGDIRGTEPSKTGGEGTNCYGEYNRVPSAKRGDSGSAARFFYCAKASKKERGEGNTHATVKPIELMRYLVRLVTPKGGLVLDPFCGSGSTLIAARMEGMEAIGFDTDEESCEIAARRLDQVAGK